MNSDNFFKVIALFIELVFSFFLFLSPLFASGLLLLLFFGNTDLSWGIPTIFLSVGAIGGILLNILVWKREKPSTFFGRLIGNSADLKEEK